MLVGSGSIRVEELGPIVKLQDLISCFPYDDVLTRYTITGKQLKTVFSHIMRNENRNSEGECYQVNEGIKAVYSTKKDKQISLTVDGKKVVDKKEYTICLQSFHFNQSEDNLGLTNKQLLASGKNKVITTSAQEVLEENFKTAQNEKKSIEGRMVYR